jgi:hypothetical protein
MISFLLIEHHLKETETHLNIYPQGHGSKQLKKRGADSCFCLFEDC